MSTIQDQPAPKPSTGDVWLLVIEDAAEAINHASRDMVIADMEERRRLGIARYGVPVQPGNGRNALVDAYQEALDLVVYLKQDLEEQATPAVAYLYSFAMKMALDIRRVIDRRAQT